MLGIKTFSCKIKVKMKQETKSQNHNETTVLDLRLRLLNRAITEYQRGLEPNPIIAQKHKVCQYHQIVNIAVSST